MKLHTYLLIIDFLVEIKNIYFNITAGTVYGGAGSDVSHSAIFNAFYLNFSGEYPVGWDQLICFRYHDISCGIT